MFNEFFPFIKSLKMKLGQIYLKVFIPQWIRIFQHMSCLSKKIERFTPPLSELPPCTLLHDNNLATYK